MIHFSHGNGFPAETYHQIIKELSQYTEVGYIPCLGHNPKYQVNNNWATIVEELIDYISSNYSEPVTAVGHSFGGVLSYFACLKRPELFNAIILLDSPIFSLWKTKLIGVTKFLGLAEYLSPAPNGTKNRRCTWPSHEAAIEHFSSKKAFKIFDPKCLRDYVYFGTEPVSENSNEIKLRFDPIIEWKIYRMLPSTHADRLPNNIPCGLLYGQYSGVIKEYDAKYMVKHYGMKCTRLLDCGHLFPFEKPAYTVAKIIEMAKALNIKL